MRARIAVLLMVAAPVRAQTATGAWTMGPNWVNNRNLSNLELGRIAIQGELAKSLLGAAAKTRAPVTATGPASYRQSSPIVPRLAASRHVGTPEEKGRLEENLNASLRFYEGIAQAKGHGPNDVAFALLYHLMNNYVVFRNIVPAATDPGGETQYLVGGFYTPLIHQEQAAYRQIAGNLTRDAGFLALSDAEKQQLTEWMAISTTLLWREFEWAKSAGGADMRKRRDLRARAAANVEAIVGAKAERVEVGEKGFAISGVRR